MNRKPLLWTGILSLLVLVLSFCADKSTTDPASKKYYGVTRDMIGVSDGKTITFYIHQGKNIWRPDPISVFTIPKDAREVSFSGNHASVHTKDGLVYIYRNNGRNQWDISNSESYPVPKKYDRVMEFGSDAICFVKGDTVDFYIKKKHYPELQFIAPAGNKGYYAAGSTGMIVLFDKALDYYVYNRQEKKWEVDARSHFQYPDGKKGLVHLTSDFGIGIIKDKSMEIYIRQNDSHRLERNNIFTLKY